MKSFLPILIRMMLLCYGIFFPQLATRTPNKEELASNNWEMHRPTVRPVYRLTNEVGLMLTLKTLLHTSIDECNIVEGHC